jgi:RNA polymerase subunit RPABC4/transcription elongation factor Spt4
VKVKLKNCIQCGRLFIETAGAICPGCFHLLQEQEEQVFRFLQRNGGHGLLEQIIAATGVPKSVVIDMLKRGWFQGEYSVEYPCERCGSLIIDGKLCPACIRFVRHEVRGSGSTNTNIVTTRKNRFHSWEDRHKKK